MGCINLQCWRFIIGFAKIHVHVLNDSSSPATNFLVGASKIGRVEVLLSYSTGDGSNLWNIRHIGGMNANNKQHDVSYSHFLVAFDRQLTYLYKLNSGDFLITGDAQVRCWTPKTLQWYVPVEINVVLPQSNSSGPFCWKPCDLHVKETWHGTHVHYIPLQNG